MLHGVLVTTIDDKLTHFNQIGMALHKAFPAINVLNPSGYVHIEQRRSAFSSATLLVLVTNVFQETLSWVKPWSRKWWPWWQKCNFELMAHHMLVVSTGSRNGQHNGCRELWAVSLQFSSQLQSFCPLITDAPSYPCPRRLSSDRLLEIRARNNPSPALQIYL